METLAVVLCLMLTSVLESSAQEGDKWFKPVEVKQDFGVDRTWELNLINKGYSLYSGLGYYKVYTQNLAWGKAWKQCDSDGAHLLILNSDNEVVKVKTLVETLSPNTFAFIIGFNDYFLEGNYLTVHGEHLESTGYLKWGSGQPDNWKGGEHCGAMRKDGTLADVHCNTAMYFICEREI